MRLILFTADWSAPGRYQARMAREIADEFGLAYTVVDVGRQPEAAGRYGLKTLPELLLAGREGAIRRWAGMCPESELRSQLREILAQGAEAPGDAGNA